MVLLLPSSPKRWSPCDVTTTRRHTCLAALLAVLLSVGLLWRPVLSMTDGLWGAPNPWSNGDFIGAYWLFWSAWDPVDWVSLLAWPYGEGSLMVSFPNPFDAWLLGPLMAQLPFPLGWNLMITTSSTWRGWRATSSR